MSDYQSRNMETGPGTSGMGDTGTASSGMGEEMTEKSAAARHRIQEKASEAMHRVSGKVSELSETVTRKGQEMTKRLRTGMDRMRHMDRSELNVMYDDVLEQARMHPGRAILISAGIGMILGMLMRGGRRH